MSYLDDPRVFFAAERTLLAWQRTAIALVGLGFVVERFGLFVRMVNAGNSAHAVADGLPTVWFGLAFLVLGAIVSALAAHQYQGFVRTLTYPEIPRGHHTWLGPLLNYGLSACALTMAAWFVYSAT
jgi:putative membrane protein